MVRIVSLLLCLAAICVAVNTHADDLAQFRRFMHNYQRVYKTADEHALRYNNFKNNLRRIEELNNQQPEATFAINKFADLSKEEFSATFLLPKFSPNDTCIWPYNKTVISYESFPEWMPPSWDWRNYSVVTPVKNQEQCGSCWTFSTTGNIEGQWAMYSKKQQLVGLSEQFIVDCADNCLASEPYLCNAGCGGGLPWLAYEYIIERNGIVTEEAYPYTGEDGNCGKDTPKGASISAWAAVSTDPQDIQQFMYSQGPLSITLNADLLMFYDSGIITGDPSICPNDGSDHAVLLVGYGTSNNGTQYWLVKNSWSTTWGMDGYFMIQSDNGLCGANACVTTSLL